MAYAAKILADSIAPNGKRLTTFELTYPRFVHSEFMTHRMFSRNAASSRAIPIEKIIERWQLGLCLGNCVKYIQRHELKNGLEDLKKARWYLDREIARMEQDAGGGA